MRLPEFLQAVTALSEAAGQTAGALENFDTRMLDFLLRLAIACAEVALGFVIGPMVRRWIMAMARTRRTDLGVMTFLGSFANISIKLIACIMALSQVGLNTNVIVGAFSALGLGISLALQNNVANVAGGLQILLTKPFTVGDYISMNTYEGTVEEIQLMFTTLKTYDNLEVVIPNSSLVSSELINYSANAERRVVVSVELPITYDSTTFQQRCMALLEGDARIQKLPAPVVKITALNPDSQTIKLYGFTTIDQYWNVLAALTAQVEALRLEMKIPQPSKLIRTAEKQED